MLARKAEARVSAEASQSHAEALKVKADTERDQQFEKTASKYANKTHDELRERADYLAPGVLKK